MTQRSAAQRSVLEAQAASCEAHRHIPLGTLSLVLTEINIV